MDTHEVLKEIREALKELREEGRDIVSIRLLEQYLHDLEQDATESAENIRTRWKMQNENNLAEYNARWEAQKESGRATNQAGQVAMRTAILINGGAAVSLLAFLGHLASSDSAGIEDIAGALFAFVFGVLFAAIGTGFNYCSAYAAALKNKIAFHILNFITILLIIGSYVAFVTGGFRAYNAFISLS